MSSRLQRWIEAHGKTVSGFAVECAISQPALSRLLDGSRRPSFEMMGRISAAACGLGSDISDYLPSEITSDEAAALAAIVSARDRKPHMVTTPAKGRKPRRRAGSQGESAKDERPRMARSGSD